MVFQSLVQFVRSKGPDEIWRKRKIFKLSAHFRGRRRNCYSLAIRAVHRALTYASVGRYLKKINMAKLWNTRLGAAANEHGIDLVILRTALARCNICIDRKNLVNLAAYEPRSFKSLTQIALARAKQDGLGAARNMEFPAGVITRGMMK